MQNLVIITISLLLSASDFGSVIYLGESWNIKRKNVYI